MPLAHELKLLVRMLFRDFQLSFRLTCLLHSSSQVFSSILSASSSMVARQLPGHRLCLFQFQEQSGSKQARFLSSFQVEFSSTRSFKSFQSYRLIRLR